MIEVGALIGKFRIIRQHYKAVCEILGDKELLFVLFGKQHTVPLTIGFGAGT